MKTRSLFLGHTIIVQALVLVTSVAGAQDTKPSEFVAITVEADDGATIVANGEVQGIAPLKIPFFVMPGKIALEARKEGRTITRTIEGARGDALSVLMTSPPFSEPQAPIALSAPTVPAPEMLAPKPGENLSVGPHANAWQRARVKVPTVLLWGWAPALALGGYFHLVALGQKDAAKAMTAAAVSQRMIGLDDEAASLLEDAKSANKWRAVCAGLSTGLFVGAGIWAGAHGATLVLDQVWISKTSAGIEGSFVW